MGYEYSVKYLGVEEPEIAEILLCLPHIDLSDRSRANKKAFHYRVATNTGQLPNAYIEIMSDGLYFCDYGEGQDILRDLVFRIALCGGKVQLIDHND